MPGAVEAAVSPDDTQLETLRPRRHRSRRPLGPSCSGCGEISPDQGILETPDRFPVRSRAATRRPRMNPLPPGRRVYAEKICLKFGVTIRASG